MGFILTIVCFSGFIYAACAWLKIPQNLAPIFSVSFICLALFGFALSGYLHEGSVVLMVSGFVFSGAGLFQAWQKKGLADIFIPERLTLIALVLISFIISQGMTFTVIDDYVYWGIIGKYLHLNNHLPTADTAIIARHLAYTPGTSIFHYFLYTIFGKYSPSISYFAQSILLISALFVVIQKASLKKSIITLCLLIILMTLFSGSVFTKLQVDYLLSVYFFAVLWIYFQKDPTFLRLATVSLPICFLFLIKEIGFLLGVFALIIIFVDLCFHDKLENKMKIRAVFFVCFAGAGLFLLKYAWTTHCENMGFSKFNSAVNLESMKHSFAIFSDEHIRNGFFIFVKDILLGPSDRLNLPYLFWYGLIVFCWVKILKKGKAADNTSRLWRLIKISALFFVIYLLMIYFMQIIIFSVGKSSAQTVGLTRYMNILFSPMVFFTVLLYVEHFFFRSEISGKKVTAFAVIILLVLGFSRVETTLNRDGHDKEAKSLAQKISRSLDRDKDLQNGQTSDGKAIRKIGVIPGRNDNHLGIKLLYHLLPHRVNPDRFAAGSKENFLSKLSEYDYVVVTLPGKEMEQWLEPLTGQAVFETGSFKSGFYKINKGKNILELEKIFETGQVEK